MDYNHMLVRYTSPTSLDREPCGTIWKEITETKKEFFIQVDPISNNKWENLGPILCSIFEPLFYEKEFINLLFNNDKKEKTEKIKRILN